MGEKIKTLAEGNYASVSIEIELNKPSGPGQQREVHIQTPTARWSGGERAFVRMALCVLEARSRLLRMKEKG